MNKSFEIKSDCCDIVKRIKAVDENYFVKYNLESHKFELHNRAQVKNTYCLTFPFETLDERAYIHTLKTRVQNSEEIFKFLEEENRKLVQRQTQQILNDTKERLYDS